VNPHRHDPRDCPTTRCRYCDGTADLWMLGELVVAPLRLAWWLAQRPVIALVLLAAGLVAAAVLGLL
jgi:hypothetical protein